jgi:hypothetical protein
MLGEFFKVEPEKIKSWQQMKNLTLELNPDGSIIAEKGNAINKPD